MTVAWQTAQVVDATSDRLLVYFRQPETCRQCERGQGCGAGIFARLIPRRDVSLEIAVHGAHASGDWVRVGLPVSTLLGMAFWAYGAPLAGFLLGAMPAYLWIEAPLLSDLLSMLGGLALGFCAWLAGRHASRDGLNLMVEPLSCSANATTSSPGRTKEQ